MDGWDNRTFRLGDDLAVGLPSEAAYAAHIDKEHCWLPFLTPGLPLPIPEPLALGSAERSVSMVVVGAPMDAR